MRRKAWRLQRELEKAYKDCYASALPERKDWAKITPKKQAVLKTEIKFKQWSYSECCWTAHLDVKLGELKMKSFEAIEDLIRCGGFVESISCKWHFALSAGDSADFWGTANLGFGILDRGNIIVTIIAQPTIPSADLVKLGSERLYKGE